ncbi:MAG TPA: Fic family protein [Clostridia bacterium]|nr:Fic family protein [Clostridia bacterium]
MASYQPPFTITNDMVRLVSEVAEKIGRLDRYQSLDAKPHLRRNNRIRSIHSSLAIEANSLSIDAVRGVIDGKTVIGPEKEIQEVKNAYKAYDELGKFDPFSIDELKRLHGIMTYLTVDESGQFRHGEEGVFDGGRCIFMAPPAMRVPGLMEDLFSWMKQARGDVHPLILSSVFHYEFVFIHPFADGNGRMARLWQTSLLCEWNPIFQYLPIESRVHAFQSEYYEAISKCHSEGSSNTFIVFMLEKISETLDLYLQQASSGDAQLSDYVRRLLDVMEYDVPYTAKRIMELLSLKSKETLRKHYINPALEMGLIVISIPDKPTSRNQTYIKK